MYKSYAPLPIMHYTVKDYAKRKFPNGKFSANEKAIKQLVTWKRSSVMLSICALVLSLSSWDCGMVSVTANISSNMSRLKNIRRIE